MARIVSGVPQAPEFDSGAILRGYEKGAKFRLAEQENARQEQELQLRMYGTLLDIQQAKAKALKDLQDQANMGNVNAQMTLAQQAVAGSLDPQQSILEGMIEMRAITDEKALPTLDRAISMYTEALKQHKQKEIFETELVSGAKNGYWDEQQLRQRRDAGESEQALLQEMQKTKAGAIAGTKSSADSAQVLSQMDAILKTIPPNTREYEAADILRHAFASDVDAQAKPGEAQKRLKGFQAALLGGAGEYENIKAAREEYAGSRPAPGLGGMSIAQRGVEMQKTPTQPLFFGAFGENLGVGGPNVPAFQPSGPQAHATVKRGQVGPAKTVESGEVGVMRGTPERLEKFVFKIAETAQTPSALREAIKKQGLELTPEIAALAKKAWTGRKPGAPTTTAAR